CREAKHRFTPRVHTDSRFRIRCASCIEAAFDSTRGRTYKALRSVVLDVVRLSVHDVTRLHTASLHSCYRKPLPNTLRPQVAAYRVVQRTSTKFTPFLSRGVYPPT